jgi:hypothetical protein
VTVDVRSGLLAVRRTAAALRALPAGTPVILLDHRPGGRLRVRRIAATGSIVLDRQYVALPSVRRAIVVAEAPTRSAGPRVCSAARHHLGMRWPTPPSSSCAAAESRSLASDPVAGREDAAVLPVTQARNPSGRTWPGRDHPPGTCARC